MRDPFAHDATKRRDARLAADASVRPLAVRLSWLRIATGGLALVLIAAIWIVWRWL